MRKKPEYVDETLKAYDSYRGKENMFTIATDFDTQIEHAKRRLNFTELFDKTGKNRIIEENCQLRKRKRSPLVKVTVGNENIPDIFDINTNKPRKGQINSENKKLRRQKAPIVKLKKERRLYHI